jgi:hypothetical protein
MRKIILYLIFSLQQLVTFTQAPLKPRDPSIIGSQTFALVVGVSKYKYVRPLTYADKDAELFRDFLKSPGGGSIKDENIFCLLNEKALNSTFWTKGFQWLRSKQLQKGDRLFIYLSGHGDAIDEDQFFFLSYDCNPAGDKNNYLVGGAIQLYNLKKKIANETAKGVDVYFIMDACRSNELPGGTQGQNFLNNAISEKKVGEIMMLASAAGQESLEDKSIGNGHGLFTYYLVDGLSGLADVSGIPDNKITFSEIKSYVDLNVPALALQKFKRKQDPVFCCNENSEKIISSVDTAYLQKWLRTKKMQNRGPGNAFEGIIKKNSRFTEADTLLVETYNRFYNAVKNNLITGKASAEEFFQQLDKKYPGNPYTLDAKSTLAVEYINFAQAKVDQYLTCSDQSNAKQKEETAEAANRLEKAIAMVREDDEDFANSLMGRMYLLKAGGNNAAPAISFQNAYSALSINPDGAYIQNKLALLHLENKQTDSALYYAEKATKTAPMWSCALNTMALVRNTSAQQQNKNDKENTASKKTARKNSFGLVTGSGVSQLNPSYTEAGNTTIIGVNGNNIIKLDLGIFFQTSIGKYISIRPATMLSLEGGELVYDRRNATGGVITQETIKLKNTSISLSVPVIIKLSDKNIVPFISLGPAFNYIVNQNADASAKVPVKKSVFMGDAGLGIDIPVGKNGIILSPELKYTQGFNNLRENTRNEYTNTLSSLKKQGITFSIYLRR